MAFLCSYLKTGFPFMQVNTFTTPPINTGGLTTYINPRSCCERVSADTNHGFCAQGLILLLRNEPLHSSCYRAAGYLKPPSLELPLEGTSVYSLTLEEQRLNQHCAHRALRGMAERITRHLLTHSLSVRRDLSGALSISRQFQALQNPHHCLASALTLS